MQAKKDSNSLMKSGILRGRNKYRMCCCLQQTTHPPVCQELACSTISHSIPHYRLFLLPSNSRLSQGNGVRHCLRRLPPVLPTSHGSTSCQSAKNGWRVISASPIQALPTRQPLSRKQKRFASMLKKKATFTTRHSTNTGKPFPRIWFPIWSAQYFSNF